MVGVGVERAEVARFHRQDGSWQTSYKGFPLYHRAAEAGSRAVDGDGLRDGLGGQWFLARDYLAFLASSRVTAPDGQLREQTFLTDGYGRTLYVCLDDRPGSASAAPESACDAACLVQRPAWHAAATLRSTALPSAVMAAALGSMVRSDGSVQLTYRGWPLYYFRGDLELGDSAGHNQRAWRAIDPTALPTMK
jgi:predicted lipoprotein with Yx(FWY)xxD motif